MMLSLSGHGSMAKVMGSHSGDLVFIASVRVNGVVRNGICQNCSNITEKA